MNIPCISMWQPWAQWVAWGWKTIETRTHDRFASLEGKTIAIQAAKVWDTSALRSAGCYLSEDQIRETAANYCAWPRGAIICLATVDRCGVTERTDAPKALIECESLRFGLYLTNVKLVAPAIPCRGRQGIFKVDFFEDDYRSMSPVFA